MGNERSLLNVNDFPGTNFFFVWIRIRIVFAWIRIRIRTLIVSVPIDVASRLFTFSELADGSLS